MSDARRPAAGQETLDDVRLLLIDGDNLLHRVRGTRDEGGVAWLLPRLREWRPAWLKIVVALDGHAAHGEGVRRRVAPGIEFLNAGHRTADDALIDLLLGQPWADRGRSIVVSDDIDVRRRCGRHGGLPRGVDWLMAQLARPARSASSQPSGMAGTGRGGTVGGVASSGIGRGRRPRHDPSQTPPASSDEPEGTRWTPGRGSTRKRGNPRRGHPPAR